MSVRPKDGNGPNPFLEGDLFLGNRGKVDSSGAPSVHKNVEDEVIVSVSQNGTGPVDERCCRPSGARGFIGSPTRSLRPGLNATAPPGLRCAERVGLCLRWKVSRDRRVAFALAKSRRAPNQILDMVTNVPLEVPSESQASCFQGLTPDFAH